MLMLNAAGVGHLCLGIVYDRISLIILHGKLLCLKSHRAVLQGPEAVVIILIYLTCKKKPVKRDWRIIGKCGIKASLSITHALLHAEIVLTRADVDTLKHLLHNLCIAAYGDTLISVVEIIVVIGKAQRQSFYNECRKLITASAPLLFSVALYQLFVYISAHQRQSLLL